MRRFLITTFIMLLLVGAAGAYYLYQNNYKGQLTPELDDPFVEIPKGADFETVTAMLLEKGLIDNESSFSQTAEYMKYKRDPMRSGRYEIKAGWTMVELIRQLRSGRQAPVNVVLNNARLLEDIAGKVSPFIEPDSSDIMATLTDDNYIDNLGYTPETLMSLFIPNTYEMYWDATSKDFIERMVREHKNFWNSKNRLSKAKKLELTPAEVYTLASIIERETLNNGEKPRMAGVYYNRLQKGMLLQADPTAVFATRDFTTTRVLNRHTQFDSPYNTYMYKGLPPGPISMASISSIDAVLNVEDHDYIYFCAKGDGSGLHNFAKTLAQHNRNAQIYKANLRKRGKR